MATQSPLITASMHRVPHTTPCGKLEDTNQRYISKQLSPRRPQTPDTKTTFQLNKGNIHAPISPGIKYQCNVFTLTYLYATVPTNIDAHDLLEHLSPVDWMYSGTRQDVTQGDCDPIKYFYEDRHQILPDVFF